MATNERKLRVVTPTDWHRGDAPPRFLAWDDGTMLASGDYDAVVAAVNGYSEALARAERAEAKMAALVKWLPDDVIGAAYEESRLFDGGAITS